MNDHPSGSFSQPSTGSNNKLPLPSLMAIVRLLSYSLQDERRTMKVMDPAVWLGQGKAIELGRVFPHDLPLFVLRNPFEISLDDLARMRPGRDGMGIIGGPHDVLHPNGLAAGHPYPIVDERRKDLAPEVFTGRELQRGRVEIPVLFLGLVQLLQKEG